MEDIRARRRLRAVALRALATVALAAGALGLLAGCGGSEPTPAEFAGEVNAACRAFTQAGARAPQDDAPLSAAGDEAAAGSPAARMGELVARLEQIEAPSELADDYARYTGAMKRFQAFTRAVDGDRALSEGELAQWRERVAADQQTLVETARALRLTACL